VAARRRQQAAENSAEFARLRAEGLTPAEAAERLGLARDTGRKYEQRRKRDEREAANLEGTG
jgi:hypothetical protein